MPGYRADHRAHGRALRLVGLDGLDGVHVERVEHVAARAVLQSQLGADDAIPLALRVRRGGLQHGPAAAFKAAIAARPAVTAIPAAPASFERRFGRLVVCRLALLLARLITHLLHGLEILWVHAAQQL